jgi:hypothetical protein
MTSSIPGCSRACAPATTTLSPGTPHNQHRDWHQGNHPGYNLARRLHDKASQAWLFVNNFKISWTNNA